MIILGFVRDDGRRGVEVELGSGKLIGGVFGVEGEPEGWRWDEGVRGLLVRRRASNI